MEDRVECKHRLGGISIIILDVFDNMTSEHDCLVLVVWIIGAVCTG